MKKLLLILTILFTGILSAQTFNLECNGGTSSSGLQEGFSAFVGEPGQAGAGSIKTYAQYSIPEDLRGLAGQTGNFEFYIQIDRRDPVRYGEVSIVDGAIFNSTNIMEGVTHTTVGDHTVVFQNVDALYNQARVRVTAQLAGGSDELLDYRNGSIDLADFPNWRQEIRDNIAFYYGPVNESISQAYYNTVLTIPNHLRGVDLGRIEIPQRFEYTENNGGGRAGIYILEDGDVSASNDGLHYVNIVDIGAFSYGIETEIYLSPLNEATGKTHTEQAYNRAQLTLSVASAAAVFLPPITSAFYPGWEDELDEGISFNVRDAVDNSDFAVTEVNLDIPEHLRGVPGITRTYATSNLLDESGGISGSIVVRNGLIPSSSSSIDTSQRELGADWNESRLSSTVSVDGTEIYSYQFGIRVFVWNWLADTVPNVTVYSGTKSIDLNSGSGLDPDGTYNFPNGTNANFIFDHNVGWVGWSGNTGLLRFPASATTDGIHRSWWGGANWMYRVIITEESRAFVRRWYTLAGYETEEY